MSDQENEIAEAARRHGLSEAAGRVLFEALVSGGGGQAQFSHPGLGGMGQWSGGMTMIGDMFNDGLKAKVAGFCADMAPLARNAGSLRSVSGSHQMQRQGPEGSGWSRASEWWPESLGAPASTGSQNAVSYACFPEKRRLAIARDGRTIVYDTGDHRISGFSQQQGSVSDLAFASENGPVRLDSLTVVDA